MPNNGPLSNGQQTDAQALFMYTTQVFKVIGGVQFSETLPQKKSQESRYERFEKK